MDRPIDNLSSWQIEATYGFLTSFCDSGGCSADWHGFHASESSYTRECVHGGGNSAISQFSIN